MAYSELKEFMDRMTTEADETHGGLMDIALHAGGAASYGDLLQMPTTRIKQLSERIQRKISGKDSDNKMLKPGEVSGSPNSPASYADVR